MRVQKSNSAYKEQELVYPRFTEPNQAFTPRQIIDQFSRGELSAKSFEESDGIYDDAYPDDSMVDNIVEFADYFEAKEFMQTTKVIKPKKKKDDSSVKSEVVTPKSQKDVDSVKADAEGGKKSDDKSTKAETK